MLLYNNVCILATEGSYETDLSKSVKSYKLNPILSYPISHIKSQSEIAIRFTTLCNFDASSQKSESKSF